VEQAGQEDQEDIALVRDELEQLRAAVSNGLQRPLVELRASVDALRPPNLAPLQGAVGQLAQRLTRVEQRLDEIASLLELTAERVERAALRRERGPLRASPVDDGTAESSGAPEAT
jgi:hypothetical protein